MNILGWFISFVFLGFILTVFNRHFSIDNNWTDGDPCKVNTPNGTFLSDHCYGHPKK